MKRIGFLFLLLLCCMIVVVSGCQQTTETTQTESETNPSEQPNGGDQSGSEQETESDPQAENENATQDEQDEGENQEGLEEEEAVKPEQRYRVNSKNFSIQPVDAEGNVIDSDEKIALLTFDDTPTGEATGQILDTLDRYDAKAIFFINGHYAERNVELLHEIKNRGHIIGNHTWWHIYIRRENAETVRKEITRLSDFIEEQLGERPTYFRPPFGQNSPVSLEIIREEGMQTMNWSNGSLDWELKTSEAIIQQVLSNMKNGDNILFHDKQVTADALEPILEQLTQMGYRFVLPTEVVLPEIE